MVRLSSPKRASVHTLGCRLNQSEALMLRDRLIAKGYEIVPFGEPADLAIINTCTVTNLADAKCRQTIKQFIRKNPDAFTAVVGCYSQMGAKEIAAIPGVDLIVGNHDKLSVLDFVGQEKNPVPVVIRDRIRREDFSIEFAGDLPFNKRANLKIQDGCDFMCSFCIIPFARGRARSRELENLVAEAEAQAARGVRELVLTGVNIGTYASGSAGIVEVVDRLNAIPRLDRIRISSIEPTTIPETLFERMADPAHALLPFLHIPLQSGCDEVLARMRRKYTVGEYLNFVRGAAARVPGLYVGADIMVGFPGETEEQFEETCRVFLDNPLAFCHVFSFSEREGTPAARASGQVPIPERARRSARLRSLSARKRHGWYESHLGQTMRVLFEDPKPGSWPGYTDNYIRVSVDTAQADGANLANRTGLVRLDRVAADFVEGALVATLD